MKLSTTGMALLATLALHLTAQAKNYQFIVGTFTGTSFSQGIYQLKINTTHFKADTLLVANAANPNFLCLSNDQKHLYAVSTAHDKSTLLSFDFRNKNRLTSLNVVDAGTGKEPCHVALTQAHVVVANYSGGSVFVYKRKLDNSLSEVVQQIQLTGSSIHPTRQQASHAHQVVFSPDNQFLLITDLGADKVMVYKYTAANANRPFEPFSELKVKSGSGPRHLTFDKKGQFIYLLHELDGTLSTLRYNQGKLTTVHTNSVVRKANLQTGAADIHVSPDGKFVYATNRGNVNDISCFRTSSTGELTFVQQLSTQGVHPRNFVITRDGKFVLVGNMRSNEISIFSRNKKTGVLTFTGKKVQVGAPACLIEF